MNNPLDSILSTKIWAPIFNQLYLTIDTDIFIHLTEQIHDILYNTLINNLDSSLPNDNI